MTTELVKDHDEALSLAYYKSSASNLARCYIEYSEAITRLTAERDAAIEALRVFAEEAFRYEPPENDDDNRLWDCRLTIGDLREAARLVAAHQQNVKGE